VITFTPVTDLAKMDGVVRTDEFGAFTFIVPIEIILSHFDSTDNNDALAEFEEDVLTISEVLDDLRDDDRYFLVRDSIASNGFIDALEATDTCKLMDGHHRLAAAIDLGYTRVPVRFTRVGEDTFDK
jgi:hypothetical protein